MMMLGVGGLVILVAMATLFVFVRGMVRFGVDVIGNTVLAFAIDPVVLSDFGMVTYAVVQLGFQITS